MEKQIWVNHCSMARSSRLCGDSIRSFYREVAQSTKTNWSGEYVTIWLRIVRAATGRQRNGLNTLPADFGVRAVVAGLYAKSAGLVTGLRIEPALFRFTNLLDFSVDRRRLCRIV